MKTHDLGKVTKIWNHPSEKSCSQTTMKVKHRGTREKVQQAKCLQCGAEFRTHVKSQAGCMHRQAQETWESETPWAPDSLAYAMAMESHVKQADNEDRHQKLYLPHAHPIHTHEHTCIIHIHTKQKQTNVVILYSGWQLSQLISHDLISSPSLAWLCALSYSYVPPRTQ